MKMYYGEYIIFKNNIKINAWNGTIHINYDIVLIINEICLLKLVFNSCNLERIDNSYELIPSNNIELWLEDNCLIKASNNIFGMRIPYEFLYTIISYQSIETVFNILRNQIVFVENYGMGRLL